MKVKVSRIRHPLASFTGEIFVGDEKRPLRNKSSLLLIIIPYCRPIRKSRVLEGSQKSEVEGSDLVHS